MANDELEFEILRASNEAVDDESAQGSGLPPNEVAELARTLTDEADYVRWLKTQKSDRNFRDMFNVGALVEQTRPVSAKANNLVTQSFNELGHYEEARRRAMLLRGALSGETGMPNPENALEWQEAVGHSARAFKQSYVDQRIANPDQAVPPDTAALLQEAISLYSLLLEYDGLRSVWGGVNVAACMVRAEKDGISSGSEIDIETVCSKVISCVETRKTRVAELAHTPDNDELIALKNEEVWDIASEAEALLGLKRYKDAREKYVELIQFQTAAWKARKADAPDAEFEDFALASAFRQLREVWGLSATHPDPDAAQLYNHFHMLIARLPNSETDFTIEDVKGLSDSDFESGDAFISESQAMFEAIHDNIQPVGASDWSVSFTNAMRAIAMVGSDNFISPSGEYAGTGTGFLIDGGLLNEAWSGEKLFVTNEHVLSRDEPEGSRENIAAGRITFTVGDQDSVYRVKDVLWQSAREHHDVTICRLDREPPEIAPFDRIIEQLNPLSHYSPPLGVTIMGHPRGQRLHFSRRNNDVMAHDGPDHDNLGRPERLHYKASTDKGNSGSPALECDTLTPIGVHHSGRGSNYTYEATAGGAYKTKPKAAPSNVNEAISLASIKRAIRKWPNGINRPRR